MIMEIIPIEGEIERREVVLPPEPSYDQLRALLDPIFHAQRKGAWFEHVTLFPYIRARRDMFVDDEGAIVSLPINERATLLYSLGRRSFSYIHGIAVYFPDQQVWF